MVAVAGLSTLDRIRLTIFALISLTACLLASGVWSPELYRRLGYAIDDWRQVQLLSARPDPRIAVVDIDERSLEAIGPWPWPRAVIARLAQNLFVQYHAKAVGLDVMFPEAASPQGDHALLAVAHQFPLVFAQAFAMSANADALIEVLGSDDFAERIKRRESTLEGINRGVLIRQIFAARAAGA